MKTHFKIILTCWNAEKWIECSVRSVLEQSYKNWELFIVDDCSSDKTLKILKRIAKGENVYLTSNAQRVTKLSNIIHTIKKLAPADEDVLVFIDGDDMLFDKDALKFLASVYEKGSVWVTWGSYDEAYTIGIRKNQVFGNYKKYPSKHPSEFAQPAPKNWKVRSRWLYSHLKTAKFFLWRNIKDETFRDEKTKEYYSRVDDFFMVPLLEMAGPKHSKYIRRIMYVRSRFNHYDERTDATLRKTWRINKEVKGKPPYSRKTRAELINNG